MTRAVCILLDVDGLVVGTHTATTEEPPSQIRTPRGQVFRSTGYRNLDGSWVFWEAA